MLLAARRILIAADFDGTLCKIVPSPDAAHLAPRMRAALRLITNCDRFQVAVISGREQRDVLERLPFADSLVVAGNHGLEVRGRGLDFEHALAVRLSTELDHYCRNLQETIRPFPGAWIEAKRLTATVHYRAVDSSARRELRCAVRRSILGRSRWLGIRSAIEAMELHPRIEWDKGAALRYIRDRCGPFDLCISIGDDNTDETMFAECRQGFSVKVGTRRPTVARFCLRDPDEVATLLMYLWAVCDQNARVVAAGAPAGQFETGRLALLHEA
jgi:trehalose-phosphatase